jgi:hypothetical protein
LKIGIDNGGHFTIRELIIDLDNANTIIEQQRLKITMLEMQHSKNPGVRVIPKIEAEAEIAQVSSLLDSVTIEARAPNSFSQKILAQNSTSSENNKHKGR